MVSLAARREVVRAFRERFAVSERRACDLAGLHRSVQRYRSVRRQTPRLVVRLAALAAERPRFGYLRLTVMLRSCWTGFRGLPHRRLGRYWNGAAHLIGERPLDPFSSVARGRRRRPSTSRERELAEAAPRA